MIYMLQGEEHKLRRPIHGPYRVLSITETNAEVQLVDSHTDDPIFVILNRVRLCHPEQGESVCTAAPLRVEFCMLHRLQSMVGESEGEHTIS